MENFWIRMYLDIYSHIIKVLSTPPDEWNETARYSLRLMANCVILSFIEGGREDGEGGGGGGVDKTLIIR